MRIKMMGHQLGWVALEPEQQRDLVARLAARGTDLSTMIANVDAYRQWNSAANEAIMPLIRSLLQR